MACFPLEQEQLETYQRQGFVKIPAVFGKEELDRIKHSFDAAFSVRTISPRR